MRISWMVLLGLLCTVALAGPNGALMATLDNLKAAVATKLDMDNSNCQRGNHNSCQDVLLDTVELNNVNSEIALRKLENIVRSSQTKELIDDAIAKLSNVNSAITEIREKLDE